jgi:hypothetical protein
LDEEFLNPDLIGVVNTAGGDGNSTGRSGNRHVGVGMHVRLGMHTRVGINVGVEDWERAV